MPGRKKPEPATVLATVSPNGRHHYAQEFIEVVVAKAFKQSMLEASAYYDVPYATVRNWCKLYKDVASAAATKQGMAENPYRGGSYGISKRLQISDKLFAELEHTLEISKMKHGGYIPADILQRLVNTYGVLVDKRRLEEGIHTALVTSVKEPEEIFQDGDAKVVEFRQRALTAGESSSS